MKKLIILITIVLTITTVIAQTPNAFNYQAIARGSTGSILQNHNISVKISILSGSTTGTVEYSETHTTATNKFGLFTLSIGNGSIVSGTFFTIEWGNNTYYVKIDLDASGGTNYQHMGTSQLLSVPYALYAENTRNVNDADADPKNEIQILSIHKDIMHITNGNFVNLDIDRVDRDSTNELQVLSFSNDTLYLEKGGFVDLAQCLDSTKNQTLSYRNDTLFLSNGNYVKLPNAVVDADSDPKNEIQYLTQSNNKVTLSKGGGSFTLPYLPLGIILPYAGNKSSIPNGWLLCNGQAISHTIFSNLYTVIGNNWGAGNDSTTFNLPDLRGKFLRGVDLGTGNDPDANSRKALYSNGNKGDNVGSYQDDELKSHKHSFVTSTLMSNPATNALAGSYGNSIHSANTNNSGGSETRPKNAYVNYIIKY